MANLCNLPAFTFDSAVYAGRDSFPVGNNRTLTLGTDPTGRPALRFTLHGFPVAVFTACGDVLAVRLDACGWPTKTTAAAINEALSAMRLPVRAGFKAGKLWTATAGAPAVQHDGEAASFPLDMPAALAVKAAA